jgi:hypothetical protein
VRVRKQLDCRSVSYTSLNKESHVLEVPEASAGRMPSCYSLVGHRKGFKRYSSSELQGLVADKAAAEEERERVEAGVLRVGGGEELGGWYQGLRQHHRCRLSTRGSCTRRNWALGAAPMSCCLAMLPDENRLSHQPTMFGNNTAASAPHSYCC